MYFRPCSSQEFGGNIGVVADGDMELRVQCFCCRCVFCKAQRRQKQEGQKCINIELPVHSVTPGATLLSVTGYLNAPEKLWPRHQMCHGSLNFVWQMKNPAFQIRSSWAQFLVQQRFLLLDFSITCVFSTAVNIPIPSADTIQSNAT